MSRRIAQTKRPTSMNPTTAPRPFATGLSGFFFIALGMTLLAFLYRAFSDQLAEPRFFVLLLPVFEPGGFFDTFWGNTLVPFTAGALGEALCERFTTLLYAGVCVAAAYGVGRALLDLLTGASFTQAREYGFFALVTGFALWTSLLSWLGLAGMAHARYAIGILTVVCSGFGLLRLVRVYRAYRAYWANSVVPVPVPRTSSRVPLFNRVTATLLAATLVAFVLLYLLNGTAPTRDYDMLEYHLQAAREFYESGRIAFVPHNVYMNMPLGVETLHLWGMNLTGDVFTGAMLGKTLVVSLAFVAAWGLALLICRITNEKYCALLAAVCWLSFPDNFSVFTNGLNDGVAGLILIALALLLWLAATEEKDGGAYPVPVAPILGLLVGWALACKYTGLVFVLVPTVVAVVLLWRANRLAAGKGRFAAIACLGLVFGCGAWYLRNIVATGNPFYPLLYSVFGDSSGCWNGAIDARWTAAHSPDGYAPLSIFTHIAQWSWTSVTASPVLCWTLPAIVCYLAMFRANKVGTKRGAIALALSLAYTFFYLFVWWGTTHRIDRFLVPVLPAVVIVFTLACDGLFHECKSKTAFRCGVVMLLAFAYLLVVASLFSSCALLPWRVHRESATLSGDWPVWFRRHRAERETAGETILLVHQAQTFLYDGPVLYSTCWNDNPIWPVLRDRITQNDSGRIVAIRDPDAVRQWLKREKIGWILCDQAEWRRFMSKGNYGLNHPELDRGVFELLSKYGVVEPFCPGECESFAPGTRSGVTVYRVR